VVGLFGDETAAKSIVSRPKYGMDAKPLHLREANEFVAKYHRHNMPTVGGKFALGVVHDGKLVGVGIAGRPLARKLDDGKTLEVLRVCTDGTANACSFLYSRIAKIARLMGYERIITYTLESEGGASLRAIGAKATGPLHSHDWGNAARPRKSQAVCHEPKYRWEL
jgi:hypothetical protein